MADEMNLPKGALMAGKRGVVMGVANANSIAWGIASQLAAQGAEMAFTYLEGMERRVAPLAESIGVKLLAPAEVTDDVSMDAAFRTIEKTFGTIDFLVHAIAFSDKAELKGSFVENTTRANFLRSMDVSAFSWVDAARRASKLMPHGGSMITLTYLGSERTIPNYNVMGVCKAALEAATRYIARDLGPAKIRVNAISAGPIRTLSLAGISGGRSMIAPGSRGQRQNSLALGPPDLDQRGAAGRDQAMKSRNDNAIIVQTLRAGKQRLMRFVPRDRTVEHGVAFDIRRIGQHEIKAAQILGPTVLRPVARHNLRPVAQPQRLRIAPRDSQRAWRSFDAHPGCVGPFAQRGKQQCARARAQIDDPQRRHVAQPFDRDFDQCLGIAARDQHVGGNRKVQPPEFLMPGDIGDRFVPQPPIDQGVKPRRNRIAHMAQDHVRPRDAQRMRHQHFGIEPCSVAERKPVRCRNQRARNDHRSSAASRLAWSSAISASINSPRPVPARISGRRCRVRLMR